VEGVGSTVCGQRGLRMRCGMGCEFPSENFFGRKPEGKFPAIVQ